MQSFLFHAYGLHDQDYLKTNYEKGCVYFHVKTKDIKLRCSCCQSRNVIKKGSKERVFKAAPVGLKTVFVVGHVQRLECKDCNKVLQEKLSYADEKKSTLKLLHDM